MSDAPIRIWLALSHHAAFRCGGWAFVRAADGAVTGVAGGERNLTGERIELAGLAAALETLPAGAEAVLHTLSVRILRSAAAIAGTATGEQAPSEDLDLWARIVTAAKGRSLRLVCAEAGAGTPLAFAAAWAEFARDKAKAAGAFASPIPKTNLAKLRGL
ncbi:hypothetical protein [Phenylobacterium sp.]|uniref:hypothetical protein n=1 Tax=Phenylobacterium sp. TaxID=1871053 RepID=UPI0035B29C65